MGLIDQMKRVYGLPLLGIVGMGFWVQGFRCFPWLAVNYYLKDNLKLDPGMLQFLQQTSNLPFLAKPLYGIVSDSVYIHGAHRVPYLILAGLIQVLSWGTIAFHSSVSTSVGMLTLYLTLSNFGVAIGEVANDAMIAEYGKNRPGSSPGDLQSFAFLAASSGTLLGNLLAGVAMNSIQSTTIFVIFFILVASYVLLALSIEERSLSGTNEIESKSGNDKKDGETRSARQPLMKNMKHQLMVVMNRPDILRPIIWFTFSVSIIPSLLGCMFFYQTEVVKVDSFYLGLSKTVGQLCLLLGSTAFNMYLKDIPLRKLATGMQLLLVAAMLSDIFLVKGWHLLSDKLYVVLFSGVVEAMAMFKVLPFMVLLGKLCPPGSEGTLMALFSACLCLANLVSGYFGVALASLMGISSSGFGNLDKAILVEAALGVLPIFFVSLLPQEAKRATS